jgi:hypothetical protein
LASPEQISAILAILQQQIACAFLELQNRAYLSHHIGTDTVRSAWVKLTADEKIQTNTLQAFDAKKTKVSFVNSTDYDPNTIHTVISRKLALLSQHYELSDIIGHHGETLVAQACANVGYTEIEVRKEKHGTQDLGISKRDIDIFAKHPTGNYYQNIEVKNRRDRLKHQDVSTIVQTTRIAKMRWELDIRPAVVTVFTTNTARQAANLVDLAIAYSGGELVPIEHRHLYNQLNDQLCLNVTITDEPPPLLQQRIDKYIVRHEYKPESAASTTSG